MSEVFYVNGVILVNKSDGKTSRDVVNDISHILHTKKVGHTGTLDPIAKGVLVVTVGRYTKLNELLMSTYKEYIAEAELDVLTDTLDSTGKLIKKYDNPVSEDEIRDAILSFKGCYDQEVPLYSSIKVNGKKLYEYARENKSVVLPKREVHIKEIEVLEIKDKRFKFRVLVSKGTYIRSLIRDIGAYLNTGAIMTSLIRTKQGKFNIQDTFTVEDIRDGNFKMLKLEEVMDVEVVDMDDDEYFKVKNGAKMIDTYNKKFVLFKYQDKEISLYKKDGNFYRNYLSIDV